MGSHDIFQHYSQDSPRGLFQWRGGPPGLQPLPFWTPGSPYCSSRGLAAQTRRRARPAEEERCREQSSLLVARWFPSKQSGSIPFPRLKTGGQGARSPGVPRQVHGGSSGSGESLGDPRQQPGVRGGRGQGNEGQALPWDSALHGRSERLWQSGRRSPGLGRAASAASHSGRLGFPGCSD